MKVRKLLEIQSTVEEAIVPCDMNEEDLEKHYSESKGEYIDIVDMDLIHLVRSYSKCIGLGKVHNKKIVLQSLNSLSKQLETATNTINYLTSLLDDKK